MKEKSVHLVNEKIFVSTKLLLILLSSLDILLLYHIPMHTPSSVRKGRKKCNLCNRNFPSLTTWLTSLRFTPWKSWIAFVMLGLGCCWVAMKRYLMARYNYRNCFGFLLLLFLWLAIFIVSKFPPVIYWIKEIEKFHLRSIPCESYRCN